MPYFDEERKGKVLDREISEFEFRISD